MWGVHAQVETDSPMTRAELTVRCFGALLAQGSAVLLGEEACVEKSGDDRTRLTVELDPTFACFLKRRGVALEGIWRNARGLVVRARIRFLGTHDIQLEENLSQTHLSAANCQKGCSHSDPLISLHECRH